MNRLKGKVALITGGTRGIGRGIVEKYAEQGAEKIFVTARSHMEFKNPSIEFEQLDVADFQAVGQLVNRIDEQFGRIDILVNNAGINEDAMINKMTPDQWGSVLDINLTGVYNLTHHVSKIMLRNEKGSIINMSSLTGVYGNIGQSNYAATKGGLIAMTWTWAKELARKGANIRTNCIAPGFIKTAMTQGVPEKVIDHYLGMIPLKRLGEVEDVANLALFLGSDESEYITGQTIAVAGGLTL